MHTDRSQDDDHAYDIFTFVSELSSPRAPSKKRKSPDRDPVLYDDEASSNLEAELKDVNGRYSDYKYNAEAKSEGLRRDLSNSQETISKLNTNIQNLFSTIAADQASIAELKKKLENTESELKDQGPIKDALAQSIQQLQSQKLEIHRELTQTQKSQSELTETLNKLTQEYKLLCDSQRKTAQDFEDLKTSLSQEQKKSAQQEKIIKLDASIIERSDTTIKKLKSELKETKDETAKIAQLHEEQLTLNQHILDHVLSEEKQKVSALEKTLHEAQDAINKRKRHLTTLTKAHEKSLNTVKETLFQVRSEIAAQTHRHSSLQTAHQETLAAERKTIVELKNEIETKDTRYASVLAEHTQKLDRKNKEILELKTDLEKEKASAEDLTQALTALVEETTATLQIRTPSLSLSSHSGFFASPRPEPMETSPALSSPMPVTAISELTPEMVSSLSSSAQLALLLSLLVSPARINPSAPVLFALSQSLLSRGGPLSPSAFDAQQASPSIGERPPTPSSPTVPRPPF